MTTIKISQELHDYLEEQGLKGESFETVLRRLLKAAGHTVPTEHSSTGYTGYKKIDWGPAKS
jgi:negative regulator of replication initiation